MFKNGLILLVLAASLAPRPSEARVVRFVVEQKRPLAEETSFGSAGAYERLEGTADFEVDPRDPLNAVIVNLDKASKNARGMVEFSAPFMILKPVDAAKGNHKIFYGVNNRGNHQAISYFNFGPGGAAGNNPLTAADLGDGFLMRLGYTIVDAGWEGDLVPGNGRLVPKFPVATQPDGRPIVARVRIEYSTTTKKQRAAAGDPRNSLEERYGSHQGYVKAVMEQAKTLVAERFLLEEDAARAVREAETGKVLTREE